MTSIIPYPFDHTPSIETINLHQLDRLTLYHMQSLIAPYFHKLELIDQGKTFEAVSIRPRGIWISTIFAMALKSLGDRPIQFNDSNTSPASELHKRLKDSRFYVTAKGNMSHWERVKEMKTVSTFHPTALQMKKGVKPSEAFTSFSKTLSFIDCTGAVHLAQAHALIDLLGEEKFDQIMACNRTITIGDPEITPFSFLLKATHKIALKTLQVPLELCPGQLYFISSAAEHRQKHPSTFWGGFNLLYVGNDRFTGIGLSPSGSTLEEIRDIMFDDYQSEPIAVEDLRNSEDSDKYNRAIQPECKFKDKLSSEPITFSTCDLDRIRKKNPQSHIVERLETARKMHLEVVQHQFTTKDLFTAELLETNKPLQGKVILSLHPDKIRRVSEASIAHFI
ncbi:MAG: hypothetical protein P0S94_04560 [Simkaniaceae bacterium]|nr:hypothetical protein [Simkaniaceae bacterium]